MDINPLICGHFGNYIHYKQVCPVSCSSCSCAVYFLCYVNIQYSLTGLLVFIDILLKNASSLFLHLNTFCLLF